MKQKIKWSAHAWIITISVTVALCAALSVTSHAHWRFYLIVAVTAILFLSMLLWSPRAVSIDDSFLTIHKLIGKKRIRLADIDSATFFVPTVDRGLKLCGSGGFAGYYGWHNDSKIGSYFGYYGDRYESFLVRLNNGKQYVVGGEDVMDIIKFINDRINRPNIPSSAELA